MILWVVVLVKEQLIALIIYLIKINIIIILFIILIFVIIYINNIIGMYLTITLKLINIILIKKLEKYYKI